MTVENTLAAVLRELAEPTEDERRGAEARVAALSEELQDPREWQRIADLGDLLEAEDALYDEALAAIGRGDIALAERLLRRCAALGDPAADDLLADLATPEPADQPQLAPAPETAPTGPSLLVEGIEDYLDCAALSRRVEAEMHSEGPSGGRLGMISAVMPGRAWWDAVDRLKTRELGDRVRLAKFVNRQLEGAGLPTTTSWRIECAWAGGSFLVAHAPQEIGRTGLEICWTVALTEARSFVASRRVGRVAADVLAPYPVPHVDIDESIGDALDRVLASGFEALPVGDRGTVLGTVTLADLASRARSDELGQTAATAMQPPVFIKADTPLEEVRDRLLESLTGLLVVLGSDGTVAGYVTAATALAGQTEPPPSQRGTLVTGRPDGLILAST